MARRVKKTGKGEKPADKLRRTILSFATDKPERIDGEFQDILQFLRSAGQTPTPVQRFVLKLIYKIPLDDKELTIELWDKFKERLIRTVTEVGFFHWLKEQNQINIPDPKYHLREDVNFTQFVFPWGRRGGKSSIVGYILGYEMYDLLHYYDPHDFFGIISTDEIRVMSIGVTKDQAESVKSVATACIDGHQFFDKYKLQDSKDRISFKTQKNIDRGENEDELKERPGVVMATYPCNQRMVRSKGNMILVFDEIAHYIREMNSVTGDDAVVNAATPSQAAFHHDFKDGFGDRQLSKTFFISDPLDEAGRFHQEYKNCFDEDEMKNHLMIQMASRTANPGALTTEFLKGQWKDMTEREYLATFEAKFTMGITSFIEDESWLECFEEDREWLLHAKSRVWYYAGMDLGFSDDKAVISIVHRTNNDEIIHDYQAVFWPKEYQNEQELYDDFLKEAEAVYNTFQPRFTVADQWEGQGITNACKRFGLKITLVSITDRLHSAMAKLFRSKLRAKKFRTTNKEEGKSFREELVNLRKLERRLGIIRVEKSPGHKDDEFDSIIRACWAAEKLEERQHMGLEEVEFQFRVGRTAGAAPPESMRPMSEANQFRRGIPGRGYNRWGMRRR